MGGRVTASLITPAISAAKCPAGLAVESQQQDIIANSLIYANLDK